MELIKENINICRRKQQISTQFAVNEDLNLPEYMEDIEKTIMEKGEFILQQVKTTTDKVIVKGIVRYSLLYTGGGGVENISAFTKETQVEENVHIDGVNEHDEAMVDVCEENFNINIINSRKINAKMIVGLNISVQEVIGESIATGIRDNENCLMKTQNERILQLCVQNNDIFRFHNQQAISKDMPNIESILYENITPRDIELRCDDDSISIDGRMHVFVLYSPEGRNPRPHWFEYEFPIHGKIDCAECQQGMIGDLRWVLSHKEVEVKEDNENENRVISVDGVLDIGIDVYEEEAMSRLEDVYAIDKNVVPEFRTVLIPKLLMKNNSVCRLNKRMKVADKNSAIMQICNIESEIKQELVTPEKNMLIVDGHVFVKLLYTTNDDNQPFRVANGAIAFSHNIEVNGMNDSCKYRIKPVVESISATMEGSDEVEIHVQIAMDVIVFDYSSMDIIDGVNISDIPKEEIKSRPGMIGYTVNDKESLWDIAKKYHTTTDKLIEINRLNDERLKSGQKLLIIKEVI